MLSFLQLNHVCARLSLVSTFRRSLWCVGVLVGVSLWCVGVLVGVIPLPELRLVWEFLH